MRRTRHCVRAISGTGTSSDQNGGRSTATGTHHAASMSLAFIPAGSGTRRDASTDTAAAPTRNANSATSSACGDGTESAADTAADSVTATTSQRVATGSPPSAQPRGPRSRHGPRTFSALPFGANGLRSFGRSL